MKTPTRTFPALVIALTAVSALPRAGMCADNFACTVSPSSTLSYTLSASAPLINSSFRGAYTAAVSPAPQTRTKVPNAGFAGGCTSIGATQNDSVPVSGTGTADGNGSGFVPSGSFGLVLGPANPAVGTATIRGLSLNLLGGGTASVAAQVSNFGINSTFCTVNPGCNAFITLTGLTLPLGEAQISNVTAVQSSGDAVGTLTPTAPNEWDFSATVELVVDMDVTFGGNPLPIVPQTVVTVLAGHVVRSGDNLSISASIAIDISQMDGTDVPVVDQPVMTSGLPVCNGLNLLFTATIDSSSVTLDTDAAVAAAGVRIPCRADWNGNFAFDVGDIFAFLGDWFTGGPGTDFDDSGMTNIADIFAFLAGWFTQAC